MEVSIHVHAVELPPLHPPLLPQAPLLHAVACTPSAPAGAILWRLLELLGLLPLLPLLRGAVCVFHLAATGWRGSWRAAAVGLLPADQLHGGLQVAHVAGAVLQGRHAVQCDQLQLLLQATSTVGLGLVMMPVVTVARIAG